MKVSLKGKVMAMKELYSAPAFEIIRLATEDNITQSSDNNVDISDLLNS